MNLKVKFWNQEQELYYWHLERNGHFGGGFGNGKSYVACLRAFTLLSTFENYGYVIARQVYKNLRATTMRTFLKICPPEFIHTHDVQAGFTVLKNKSFIFWMHLDDAVEEDLRGLEPNSVLIDQAEEVSEPIAGVLNARVGRWDGAKVPNWLLLGKTPDEYKSEVEAYIKEGRDKDFVLDWFLKYSLWPKNAPHNTRFLVPNKFDCLTNPIEDFEFHWVYRYYYPESPERKKNGEKFYFHIERQTDESMNDAETLADIKTKDKEWLDQYYFGKVSRPRKLIHQVNKINIIDPADYEPQVFKDFMERLLERGALYRGLDHADTGITCCAWQAILGKFQIFYREYYEHGKLISAHRQNIFDLSQNPFTGEFEEYMDNLADPSIFNKSKQKDGKFWTTAMEYEETDIIEAPPISWSPADNDEYGTRNAINELLSIPIEGSVNFVLKHPITGESPCPRMLFIKAHPTLWPFGCNQIITQTKQQQRVLIGEIDGKKFYSEQRDENIVDHAYDAATRYLTAAHNQGKVEPKRKPPKRSFAYFDMLLKKKAEYVNG